MEDEILNSSEGGADSGAEGSEASQNQEGTSSDFSIPEEYAEKGWAKFFNGKTGDDLKAELFKSYDNQQALIGKKVNEYLTTTDLKNLENYEDIKKALQAQLTPEYNVPENISDYALDTILKDENGQNIFPMNQEVLDLFSGKFKDLGVSIQQGQELLKTYLDYEIKEFQAYTDADELDREVNSMFNGNQQQRKTCESLIKEFLSPADQQLIQDTMPNAIVQMFYKVAKGLVDKYDYKEGSNPAPSSMKMSDSERNAEYNRLADELEALDGRPHSAEEKQNIINQMKALYK